MEIMESQSEIFFTVYRRVFGRCAPSEGARKDRPEVAQRPPNKTISINFHFSSARRNTEGRIRLKYVLMGNKTSSQKLHSSRKIDENVQTFQ